MRFLIAMLLTSFGAIDLARAADEQRSLPEVHRSLYGGSLEAPSPDSLLGKYLNETGAQTVSRRFLTAPKHNRYPESEKGPERLVVSISKDTYPTFEKYFNSGNMLYLFYEPHGNMHAVYRGMYGNYARLESRAKYAIGQVARGTLMVPIILSDSEAERATRYFEMGRDPYLNRYAQQPWLLHSDDQKPYSAKTGFMGCTSWFGTIPIGDELVDSYVFPSEDIDGMNPRIQKLIDYVKPDDLNEEKEKVLRSVWTVPGHKQLGELLDPMANRRGEFTNVGWIAYSLLGSQGTDRVPLVFLLVDDVKKEIDRKFKVDIEVY